MNMTCSRYNQDPVLPTSLDLRQPLDHYGNISMISPFLREVHIVIEVTAVMNLLSLKIFKTHIRALLALIEINKTATLSLFFL